MARSAKDLKFTRLVDYQAEDEKQRSFSVAVTRCRHIVISYLFNFVILPLLLVCLWEHKEQTANQKSPSWNEIDSVGAEQSVINTVGRSKVSEKCSLPRNSSWALLHLVCTSRC